MSSVLGNFTKVREYIQEARKFGVEVVRPDINSSDVIFTVKDGIIYFGLLAIFITIVQCKL
jgi:DNA polymerase-3 subunit alpha